MTQAVRHIGQGLQISIYVQPRASRDQWMGEHGDALKLAITAPPVDGKANQYLIRFLAKQFGVPKQRVSLLRGQSSRYKQFSISDPTRLPDELAQWLTQ
ncbi:DUF167 family protein [Dongshaea marina]|uniref:DUF167 family protein n=1 Tax=Dongshaea marina TaxID=2047966 RepID=UPI000D3EDB39|nr:DUF167 family protein [Dongshaea marina]